MAASPHFGSHVPSLAASAGGTVLAATLASYLGPLGTVGGLIAGSLLSGTTAWLIERGLRRSSDLAREKAKAVRARGGRPLTAHETQVITAIVNKHHRHIRWQPLAGIATGALVIATGTLVMWEIAAGKPVAAVVQHRPGHGLTVGGQVGTPARRAAPPPPPPPPPGPPPPRRWPAARRPARL
jgi:hypothetical protein